MAEKLVRAKHIKKSYGSLKVLDDISFSFDSGKIVGLLGPNGSGKTSLIKIMTGLIKDYNGIMLIDGHLPDVYTKNIIAYLPEKLFLPDWMYPIDAVNYFNDFFEDFDRAKSIDLIKYFELPSKQNFKSYSKGMQEKLQLALVMARKAKLYILDEPLGGVDPATRSEFLDIIMKNYADSASVLISTHLIHDVQNIFDRVIMIGGGQVLVNTDVEKILETGRTVEEAFKEVFSFAHQTDKK